MERIVRFFVERHTLVNVVTGALVALGVLNLVNAKVEGFPGTDFPRFIVTARLPGASARDIEAKLTIPIEEAISEVDGILHYTTMVTQNRSVTTIDLQDDARREEILDRERELRAAIDRITDFPLEMRDEPMFRRVDPTKRPILEIALSGPSELLPAVSDRLEHRLRSLPIVGDVGIVGLPDPEISVYLDPELARAHAITLLDVVQALERRNISSTGGALETARERKQVVLWSRFETPEEVGDVILRFDAGQGALRVRDIARIELGREDVGLIVGTNGRPGISLVPTTVADADMPDAQADVMRTLEEVRLPEGVEASVVNDSTFEIRNRLDIITNNGALGITFVATIVFIFLAPSAAMWVCFGVPLVILAVLIVMPGFGIGINFVSTIAFVVVLGLLVDDAVVVAEKILLKRQEGLSAGVAAIAGTVEVARPVLTSAITTILAFAPIMAIGGFPRRIIWQLPAVVCIALILSLLESFVILPAHMSMVRKKSEPRPKRRFVLRLEEGYRRLLQRWLTKRGRVIAVFVGVWLVIMLGIAPTMQFEFFPQEDSKGFYLKVSMPAGTPLERTEAILDVLQLQIPRIMGDDLQGMTARVGHQDPLAIDREYGSTENEGLIAVYLDLAERRHNAASWIERVKAQIRVPAEAKVVYEAALDGPPDLEPIRLFVLSNDDTLRHEVAVEIKHFAVEHGAVDVDIDERPGMRQIDLNLDYEKLALRGLDVSSVARTLQGAFYGLIATEIRDLDHTIDVRVLFEPGARRDLDALLDTSVRNARGELVTLRDVVSPAELPAPAAIHHRDGVRAASVTGGFGPHSPYTATTLADLMERELLPRFDHHPDLEVELHGEVVQSRKATGDLAAVFVLSVIGIACVIAIMLGSFLEAAFVVAVVPFAAAAVVLTFFLHGMHFSLLAVIGMIGLAGVVVNSAIVMLDSVHRVQAELQDADELTRTNGMIDALVGRLRPILVTSLSTFVGVLPTAYGFGGYDAVMSPMSLALGWGLALSTLVTLFLVPSLYVTANDWNRRIDRWRS